MSEPYGIVYVLTSPSGKQYVGQTTNLTNRLKSHRKDSKRDRYAHFPLYRSIRKYGLDTFTVNTIAEAATPEALNDLEIFFIAKMDVVRKGLNLTAGGLGHRGAKKTPKQIEAIRKIGKMPKSEEHRKNMSEAHIGMKKPWTTKRNKEGLSEESKRKISNTLKQFNKERKRLEIFPHGEERGYWRGCKCKECKRAAADAAYVKRKRKANEQ